MASIFKHEPTGQIIRPGKTWRDENSTQQPGNWQIWKEDYKASMGIKEIVQESPPDSRLYTWSQNRDGSIDKTPKSLEDINTVDRDGNPVLDGEGKQHVTQGVKSSLKKTINSQQGSLLIQTDWLYIRKIDKSVEIPVHIQSWRDSVRVQGDAMKSAIDAASTIEEIVELFVVYRTNDNGSQTKSGILYDWPELEE
jgi:hypothetical protein